MKKIHMKQYIRTLMLAVALAPVFSSCDYLDKEPDDMLTLDAVFDNADYTKQWLAGVYNLVPDPLWEYMTYEGYGYYMMSDETHDTLCRNGEFKNLGPKQEALPGIF